MADGTVAAELLDDKVVRLLRVAREVGALAGADGHVPDGADGYLPGVALVAAAPKLVDPAMLRRTAAASFVLLRNSGDVLPLDPGTIRRVAVVGPNAVYPTIQGGGSAGVIAAEVSTPARALRSALAGRADVSVAIGCQTWQSLPEPPAGSLRDPVTRDDGVWLEFMDAEDRLLAAEHRGSASLDLVGYRAARDRLGTAGADSAVDLFPRRGARPAPAQRRGCRPAEADGGRRHRDRRRHGDP